MLNDIMLGQYVPGNSFLHRLEPRAKLLALFALLAAVFLMNDGKQALALSLFTFFLMVKSGAPLRMFLQSLKPILPIVLFTFLIHLFTTEGEAFYTLWGFHLTLAGAVKGFLLGWRLALLMLLSSLLTLTTSPVALTDALETLLRPLRVVGLPSGEIAMMMTIALRFVPTLIEEADRVMRAQQARGADFTTGGLKKRVQSFVPVLVPLFVSAFRRADDLAMAMEARCYHGGDHRTRMKHTKFGRLDAMAAVFLSIILAVIWAL